VVFGKGKTDRPDIAVVGEGPGANEDVHGEPFIGKAGQLLTKMLEAISYKREDVYIANVVMCRPPENRVPTKEEIRACKPYLYEQLRLVQPKTILALGITAAQCMFRSGKAMGEMRGFWGKWDDIPVRASYHPAYLLRPTGSARKADTWSDLKILAGKIATLSS
jgi:DNA polymerase